MRFLLMWEIAANRLRMQTLEFFQILAEVRAASGRFFDNVKNKPYLFYI